MVVREMVSRTRLLASSLASTAYFHQGSRKGFIGVAEISAPIFALQVQARTWPSAERRQNRCSSRRRLTDGEDRIASQDRTDGWVPSHGH